MLLQFRVRKYTSFSALADKIVFILYVYYNFFYYSDSRNDPFIISTGTIKYYYIPNVQTFV